MLLNLHSTLPRSRANGPGERTVIHLQGCRLRCPGCFNNWSWSNRPVELVDPEELAGQLLRSSSAFSISGGEPMDQPAALACLVRSLRSRDPNCSILLFTGYTTEQLVRMAWWLVVRPCLDILVSGPYRQDLRVRGVPLIGSANQAVQLLSGRHTTQEVMEGAVVEAHVAPDGTITLTGFPPDRVVEELRLQEDT